VRALSERAPDCGTWTHDDDRATSLAPTVTLTMPFLLQGLDKGLTICSNGFPHIFLHMQPRWTPHRGYHSTPSL
jgi:hypothetical protein